MKDYTKIASVILVIIIIMVLLYYYIRAKEPEAETMSNYNDAYKKLKKTFKKNKLTYNKFKKLTNIKNKAAFINTYSGFVHGSIDKGNFTKMMSNLR